MKEKLIVLSKRAVAVAWEHAKAGRAPSVRGRARLHRCLCRTGLQYARRSWTDTSAGIQTAGEGMLAWQGMRIYMDEHHSVNPGRVAGAVTGSLFAFAPTSIAPWASGS